VAGRAAVKPKEVMDGVAELVDEVRVEVLMGDGTRLIVLRQPLGTGRPAARVAPRRPPVEPPQPPVEPPQPPARETRTLVVTNTGTHIVRVSSHYPFDQVNPRLSFDRRQARGFHLDLPAGSTLRWTPGETLIVTLVRHGRTTSR
jgi:urease subunit gamma/beta